MKIQRMNQTGMMKRMMMNLREGDMTLTFVLRVVIR